MDKLYSVMIIEDGERQDETDVVGEANVEGAMIAWCKSRWGKEWPELADEVAETGGVKEWLVATGFDVFVSERGLAYSRAEIVHGTGFAPGAMFLQVAP
jgi:hypothetical protein